MSFSNKEFKIPVNYLTAGIITYVYTGIVIFLLGWCTWYVSLPCVGVLLYVVYRMYDDFKADEYLTIKPSTIAGIVVIGIVLYAIGWGRFTNQEGDWEKHNAIINDLVCFDWPVIYEGENGERAMLTYYLAQYMFPCLIGKLSESYRLAEVMNALWSYWGMILVYLNVLRIVKSKTAVHDLIVVFLLLFFSCPIEIGQMVLYCVNGQEPLNEEWFYYGDSIKLQYSGNFILLGWVYVQVVVNWMILSLFLQNYRKIQYYVPLLLPALLYGSFSFIGLIPYAAVWAVGRLITNKDKIRVVKNLFSHYNILTVLTLGSVVVIYLLGNVMSEKPSDISFKVTDYSGNWIIYLIFVCTVVALYMILLFQENRNNWLYYVTLISLLAYPLFTMGIYNDFTMRTSIPALFVLMLMTTKMILSYKRTPVRASALFLLILFSARIYVIQTLFVLKEDEISELGEDKSFGSLGQFIYRDNPDIAAPLKYNYFTYDLEKSTFYNYLAK